MKHTESIANLAAALVSAQVDIKAVWKDSVNPHFKNKYASLDAMVEMIRPALAKHGLAVIQGASAPIVDESGSLAGFDVETMLVHRSGEWLSNSAIMPLTKVDAQGSGSAMTYGRRYGLAALLSLATDEDDDGSHASTRNAAPARGASAQSAPIDERAPLDEPTSRSTGTDEPSCPTCGGAMWDNRLSKKNPKAPDWKCKSRSCDGVVWPTKAGAKPAAAMSRQLAPKSDDDAWAEAVASSNADDGLPF